LYKARLDNGEIIKKHEIEEICQFVIENPENKYQFFWEYTPFSHNEFLKKILFETRNFVLFYGVYSAIKKNKTLQEYTNKTN